MAADLHIHSMGPVDNPIVTMDDLRVFFRSSLGHPLSISSLDELWDDQERHQSWEEWEANHEKIFSTDDVWVGEVSWLKAVLLDDPDSFVPNVVMRVNEIITNDTGTVVLTPEVEQQIIEALGLTNQTMYSVASDRDTDVLDFLARHRGETLFAVAW